MSVGTAPTAQYRCSGPGARLLCGQCLLPPSLSWGQVLGTNGALQVTTPTLILQGGEQRSEGSLSSEHLARPPPPLLNRVFAQDSLPGPVARPRRGKGTPPCLRNTTRLDTPSGLHTTSAPSTRGLGWGKAQGLPICTPRRGFMNPSSR